MTTYQKPDGSVVIHASAVDASSLTNAVALRITTSPQPAYWRRLLQDLRKREEWHEEETAATTAAAPAQPERRATGTRY